MHTSMNTSSNSAGENLLAYIERIERLTAEKSDIQDDIREVFSEAGASGFDVKAMRQVIKERKMSADDRQEQEYLLDLYRRALGMLFDTPLGEAALRVMK